MTTSMGLHETRRGLALQRLRSIVATPALPSNSLPEKYTAKEHAESKHADFSLQAGVAHKTRRVIASDGVGSATSEHSPVASRLPSGRPRSPRPRRTRPATQKTGIFATCPPRDVAATQPHRFTDRFQRMRHAGTPLPAIRRSGINCRSRRLPENHGERNKSGGGDRESPTGVRFCGLTTTSGILDSARPCDPFVI